jgi:predicted PolB exonuclease-like 3'-5' exonuclease
MRGMQVAIRAVHAARSILIDTNMSRTGNAWSVPDTQTFAAKATLHELCRVMGLPGKPDGMSGAEVEKYYRDGHIREIAEYCESDVLNTYRVWLRYELFRGRLSELEFQGSEANLVEFVKARGNTKPHLAGLT